ncbi:MAG: tail fiber protein [Pseudomonadota bacterium]
MKKTIFALAATTLAYMAPAAPVQADTPFLGELRTFGFTFCPRGWSEAAGQILPINSNQSLYALLGTTYGGDGRTTFALPDLRGRVSVNPGQGNGLTNRPLGAAFGTETTAQTVAELPTHTHMIGGNLKAQMGASTTAASVPDPGGNFIGTFTSGTGAYTTDISGPVAMSGGDIEVDVSAAKLSTTGAGQPITNMAPFLVTRHCIAIQGLFPSRP